MLHYGNHKTTFLSLTTFCLYGCVTIFLLVIFFVSSLRAVEGVGRAWLFKLNWFKNLLGEEGGAARYPGHSPLDPLPPL